MQKVEGKKIPFLKIRSTKYAKIFKMFPLYNRNLLEMKVSFMQKAKRVILFVMMPFLLTGCWDYREIHNLTYLTTIAIDYEDNKFVVYLQAMNFANIAKLEGSRPPDHKSVIATAKGETIADAIFNIYNSEPQITFWGHISTIIVSENTLKQIKVEEFTDLINRYREIRYNIWIYGTNDSIRDILNATPPYGKSPYDSVLIKPEHVYKQFSDIQPTYLYKFISDYYEKGKTATLPQLSIDKAHWTEGGKQLDSLKMNGLYLYSYEDYKGHLTESQTIGKRYLNKKSLRLPLVVDGERIATVVFNKPDYKIKYEIKNGKVYYDINLELQAYIDELLKETPIERLEEKIKNQVKKEVRHTFSESKKLNVDVLNLNTPMYRYNYNTWKEYIYEDKTMENIELRNINIDIRIKHSGKYKPQIK